MMRHLLFLGPMIVQHKYRNVLQFVFILFALIPLFHTIRYFFLISSLAFRSSTLPPKTMRPLSIT